MKFGSFVILCLVFRMKLLFASDFEECGISNVDPGNLIAQGKAPTRREWPWFVIIYHNSDYIVGGTIVSDNAVITKAEAVQGKGEENPRSANEFFVSWNNEEFLAVSKIIVHPDWKSSARSYDADMAIFFLKYRLIFSETLKPICLPTKTAKLNYKNEMTVVSPEIKNLKLTGKLEIANLKALDNFECVREETDFAYILSSRSFCTKPSIRSPCRGGGFALTEKINNRWRLVGIVSFDVGENIYNCRVSRMISYTEVSKFSTWIQQYVKLMDLSCGKPLRAQSLISRGKAVSIESWPWMVAMLYGSTFICGGSIISENVILTAAHCFQDKDETESRTASRTFFIAGISNLDNISEKDFKNLQISELKIHPDWNPILKSYEGDLALAILRETITFTAKIRPICLPSPSDSIANMKGVVAGWGYTEKNKQEGRLKIAKLSVISKKDCVDSDTTYSQTLGSKSFCTEKSDSGPCRADSGGGFAVESNSSWKIMGIVSFTATHFCEDSHVVAYTDVSKYLDWIKMHL